MKENTLKTQICLIAILVLLLSFCSCKNEKSTDKDNAFLETQNYIGMDSSEIEEKIKENKKSTFLGYDGIIRIASDEDTVDFVAFESTEIQCLSKKEILDKLTDEFGECVYIDDDASNDICLNYFDISDNNDEYIYIISQFDSSENFIRFAIMKLDEPVNKSDYSSNSTMSESEAIQEAEDYVNDHQSEILAESSYSFKVTNCKMFKINTAEIESKPSDFNDDFAHYSVNLKGRYSGYDDYGNWVDSFNFDANVVVFVNDSSRTYINHASVTNK